MDLESRKKLSDLIKNATSTGTLELSTEHTQAFKGILKQSNSNVKSAFDLLFDRLKTKHSQVRISTVNIIHEIFMRSKYFRELLCNVLSVFFEYTLGLNNSVLPPPIPSALHLKAKTLEYIEKWNESYGAHYSLLRNAFYYLKNTLNLNFPEIRAQSLNRNREDTERKEKTQKLLKLKYEKFKIEFTEITNSITSLINEMESLFNGLIPDPSSNFEDLFGSDDEDYKKSLKEKQELERLVQQQQEEEDEEQEDEEQRIDHSDIVRQGGFGSLNYSINVSINPDDTKELLVDKSKKVLLSEMVTELEKYQNLTVNDWYSTLIKINIDSQVDQEYSNYLRRVLTLQQNINDIKSKSKDFDIIPFKNIDEEGENDVDNNEFDGVEMEEYTNEQAEIDVNNNGNKRTTTTTTTSTSTPDKNIYKPYYKRDIKPISVDELPEEESIEDLLKRAPIVPLDPTLLFWGEKQVSIDNGINREHRFLGDASTESVISIENFNLLNQVSYAYEETDDTPLRPCNTPLKNGTLCQRKDKEICPFHGKIIKRDDISGKPLDEDDNEIDEEDDEDYNNNNNNNTTPKKRSLSQMISGPIYKPPVKEKKSDESTTPKKKSNTSNLIDISEKANETAKIKIDKILSKKK